MTIARPGSSVTDLPVPDRYNPGPVPYYATLDTPQACDWIVRCDDCKRLVTQDQWQTHGGCHHCGNHQLREVRTLSLWEWMKLRVGIIDFPHRQAFLAEFTR